MEGGRGTEQSRAGGFSLEEKLGLEASWKQNSRIQNVVLRDFLRALSLSLLLERTDLDANIRNV